MRCSLQVPSDFRSVKLWTILIFAIEHEASYKSFHSSCKLLSSLFGPWRDRSYHLHLIHINTPYSIFSVDTL